MRSIPLFLLFAVALPWRSPAASLSFDGRKDVLGRSTIDSGVGSRAQTAIRMDGEQASGGESRVELAHVSLVPGKNYVLSASIRTEGLNVEDRARSPIAIGAAVTMASMPYDVHSASVGGTRDWTEVQLPFTAVASKDAVVLTVGLGGRYRGTAWFSNVRLDGPVDRLEWPQKDALQTFGPAYRYGEAGWIYLHIQGEPYERGYQHGRLLSHEIESYLQRCASELDSHSRETAWDAGRTTANALFLRSFDTEILQEMRGIADGAADGGAKFGERKVDFIDIVTANTLNDLMFLNSAMPMTPTGLELLQFEKPPYSDLKTGGAAKASIEHCSAFCATGKATRDGHMVIGHITMWPLTLAEQTNIMLDVQPASGHRILLQSYPGGIQSGTDWYQNDVGVVLTETTIRQSPFNINGLSVAYRARKAIQYGDNIDKVVEYLGTKNNGLYTNEWLIADARTNEIAMFELGTYKTRLYRSSKNDWFGGTEGFYWGDNNAKDLQVRLEYQPDPHGSPSYVPYVASDRDLTWQNLYEKYRGQIDANFGFLAFRSAPLVTASAMDAKVVSAEMAKNLMVWANFGKPNQREWVPSDYEKKEFDGNQGLYSGGYHLFSALPSPELQRLTAEKEKERVAQTPEDKPGAKAKDDKDGAAKDQSASRTAKAGDTAAAQKDNAQDEKKPEKSPYEDRLWKGWILPASADDTWLAAGSAAYFDALKDKNWEKRIQRMRAGFESASLETSNEISRFRQTQFKGALLLDAMRRQMGDDAFLKFMTDFFSAHTTKTVSSAQFRDAAAPDQRKLVDAWLSAEGLPAGEKLSSRQIYVETDFHPLGRRLSNTVIVYGTADEAGANRYAAEQVQKKLLDWFEDSTPLKKDFEVTPDDLRSREVVFVGRPQTNSALAAWQAKLGFAYEGAVFTVDGKAHGSPDESIVWAAANPADPKHMVLVLAGNSPAETVRVAGKNWQPVQYTAYRADTESFSGFSK